MSVKLYQIKGAITAGGPIVPVAERQLYSRRELAEQAVSDIKKGAGPCVEVNVEIVECEVLMPADEAVLVLDADQTLWLKQLLADEQAYLRDAVKHANGQEPMNEITKRFLALCLQVRKELGEPV